MKKLSAPVHSYQLFFLVGFLILVGGGIGYTQRAKLISKLTSSVAEQPITYPLYTPRPYEALITLPTPRVTGRMPLETAIQQRRSYREFADKSVTLSELSQLLWSGQGITDPETGHRSAPSARESYPFTLYVVVRNVSGLKPGLYEYLPKEHALGDLQLANAGEQLNTAGVQPGAQQAPVVFVLAAAYGNAQKILGESVVHSSALEAGHIGQNMYLQTESLGMGMVVMAGFDAAKVGGALSLDPAQTVVYLMPFGYRAPAKPADQEVLGITSQTVIAQANPERVFTAEELSQYNGKNGQPIYFAYEGKVYDVTGSDEWKDGEHYGLSAGNDLTGQLGEAPHGNEVLVGFPVVGTFSSPASTSEVETASDDNTLTVILGTGIVVLGVGGVLMMKQKASKGNKKK